MRINLQAPINQLGYGVAGLNILKALQSKVEVSLFPIGQPQVTNQADADAVKKGMETAQTFDPNAPCIKLTTIIPFSYYHYTLDLQLLS